METSVVISDEAYRVEWRCLGSMWSMPQRDALPIITGAARLQFSKGDLCRF